ncbi:MAG: hypothetical protein AAES65_18715 [Candidatus Thiodiazotropha sp. (ex. Lucinoma kazani)]
MNIGSFCEDLDKYLKKEFSYKGRISARGLGQTLEAKRKAFWLYFRYPTESYVGKETLVIAAIAFRENREGHGTRLLDFLVTIAPKYGYRFICIENIGETSRAFALKHGFDLIKPCGGSSENAIVEVDELRRRFTG